MFSKHLKQFVRNICPHSTCNDWDSFKISLFWSYPEITREQWVEGMTINSFAAAGMIEDSLTRVNIRSFFSFFPLEVFHCKWPRMRLYCPRKLSRRRCLFDMAWSQLSTGTCFVPPLEEWFSLPDLHKTLVTDVSRHLSRDKTTLSDQFGCSTPTMLSSLEETGFLRVHEKKVYTGIKHRELYADRPRRKVRCIDHSE